FHVAMDCRRLSRNRRRRARIYSMGAGARSGDADPRCQYHDRQPDRGGVARSLARRRADHAQPRVRTDRRVRPNMDRHIRYQKAVILDQRSSSWCVRTVRICEGGGQQVKQTKGFAADTLSKENAQLWINHDKAQRDTLKMAPEFYD